MTINAAMLPGLLSRFGPSLFSPAMIHEPAPVPYFSTNTFLDAFEPHPESGNMFAATLLEGGMSARPIGRESASRLRLTLEAVLAEASKIIDVGSGVVESRSIPLIATEGEWYLEEYVGDSVRENPGVLKDGDVSAILRNRRGKSRRFALRGDGGFEVSLGWYAQTVRTSQEMIVDAAGDVTRETYVFEFSDRSVDGLKALLGMKKASGQEIALELASRIYASGQYSPEEMGCSLQVMGKTSKWKDLLSFGGKWRLPARMENGEANPLVIGTRRAIQRLDRSAVRLPLAEAYWESNASKSGHLLVRLHSVPSAGVMPLHPFLKETLWDSALRLFFAPVS